MKLISFCDDSKILQQFISIEIPEFNFRKIWKLFWWVLSLDLTSPKKRHGNGLNFSLVSFF